MNELNKKIAADLDSNIKSVCLKYIDDLKIKDKKRLDEFVRSIKLRLEKHHKDMRRTYYNYMILIALFSLFCMVLVSVYAILK